MPLWFWSISIQFHVTPSLVIFRNGSSSNKCRQQREQCSLDFLLPLTAGVIMPSSRRLSSFSFSSATYFICTHGVHLLFFWNNFFFSCFVFQSVSQYFCSIFLRLIISFIFINFAPVYVTILPSNSMSPIHPDLRVSPFAIFCHVPGCAFSIPKKH